MVVLSGVTKWYQDADHFAVHWGKYTTGECDVIGFSLPPGQCDSSLTFCRYCLNRQVQVTGRIIVRTRSGAIYRAIYSGAQAKGRAINRAATGNTQQENAMSSVLAFPPASATAT
ncbi:hypothetical protein PUG81_10165 [Erwiniaceae bacterium L1_54_6]|nr:hypothetical protein [Erwiniaceae bacterium L1_54_6]